MAAADDRPGTWPQAWPVATFRDAALRLSAAERNDEEWAAAASDAAEALVLLASSHPTPPDLFTFLSPHETGATFTWTVSRYQSGDVTPVESTSFDDPADAVLWCVDFVEPDHVSAELVVSDETGLRWMAMTGLEGRTAFQLPDIETVQCDGDDTGALAATLAHWRALLAAWERRKGARRPPTTATAGMVGGVAAAPAPGPADPPEASVDPPVVTRPGVAVDPPLVTVPRVAPAATARPASRAVSPRPRPPTLGQRVEARLETIEQQQGELLDAIAALVARIEDIGSRIDGVQDDLSRMLHLLGEQGNPSVASVARALRDRWAGMGR